MKNPASAGFFSAAIFDGPVILMQKPVLCRMVSFQHHAVAAGKIML